MGTRDNTVKDFQADFKAGLDGTLYTDTFGDVIWGCWLPYELLQR
ncbi:hypothetical protein P4S64_22940 [Vibrio sp. M60_M31a]